MLSLDTPLGAWVAAGALGVGLLLAFLGMQRVISEFWDDPANQAQRHEISQIFRYFMPSIAPDVAISGFASLLFGSMVIVYAVTGNVFLVLILGLVAIGAPWALYKAAEEKRRKALEDAIPPALAQLANEVSAGSSLPAAMERVGRTAPEPADQEFAFLARAVQVQGMETALDAAAERLNLKSFDLAAAVIKVGAGPGGDIVDALKGLSQTLIVMEKLNQKLKTAAENGRRSMTIISVFAFVVICASFYLQPENLNTLLSDRIGVLCLIGAGLLYAIALVWAIRVTRVKI